MEDGVSERCVRGTGTAEPKGSATLEPERRELLEVDFARDARDGDAEIPVCGMMCAMTLSKA